MIKNRQIKKNIEAMKFELGNVGIWISRPQDESQYLDCRRTRHQDTIGKQLVRILVTLIILGPGAVRAFVFIFL